MKAGASFTDVHLASVYSLTQSLIDLGLKYLAIELGLDEKIIRDEYKLNNSGKK